MVILLFLVVWLLIVASGGEKEYFLAQKENAAKEYFLAEKDTTHKEPHKNNKNNHYGHLNTFYTELAKEKMDYFVEPLPLQGIEKIVTTQDSQIIDECRQLFEWTTRPAVGTAAAVGAVAKAEIVRIRQSFQEWDRDPLQPFLTLIKSKKMKVDRTKLDKLVKDCAVLALKLKMIYNKARPFQLCFKHGFPLQYLQSAHADTPSFPSSFALQAYSLAYVLGRKYEKHQKNIEKLANDIAWSRVYSGNNFESDISGAKQIVLNLRIYLESIDL